MHGTAINPDTCTIADYADYAELTNSSEGAAWIASMADEFGRVYEGLGPNSDMPKGSETMFFVPKNIIPEGRPITYVRVVGADQTRPHHMWRRPNRFPWQRQHQNGRYCHGQSPSQQCHLISTLRHDS